MRKLLPMAIIFQLTFAQQAEVTNVTAAQRTDGSQLVDITYDITEDTLFSAFNVTVEISFDGGATYIQTNYVDGDVGVNILPGTDKTIVWNIGQEYNNTFDEDVKIKVIATGYIAAELPFEFVTVPAGEYNYGSQILMIDYDYEIMKYEVTNSQYTEYLLEAFSEGPPVSGFYPGDEGFSSGIYTYYGGGRISWNNTTWIVEEGYGDHPVVYISWFGSWAFAEYYGLRLPDEFEWEKAARGNTGYSYPWGNSINGSRANYFNSGDPWDTGEPSTPDGTTPVGFYNGQNYEGFQTTDSPSPFGAYDMAGNVFDWTNSWLYDNIFDDRVSRGGSHQTSSGTCNSHYRGHYGNPSYGSFYEGFRCARTISE